MRRAYPHNRAMISGSRNRRFRLIVLAFAAFATVATGVAGLLVLPSLERMMFTQAGQRDDATLRLASEALRGALRRFESAPALIAERPDLVALLDAPADPALADAVNERLRLTAQMLGASDIYLMNIAGLTLAASNYRRERSFIGRSFEFRPYFTQALEGGLGRYFALGITSGERGYFFAAPVEKNDVIVGVVALKFTVDGFEGTWRGGPSDILVTDENGVVFMSNRIDWHFRTVAPLSPAALAQIERNRQYPLDQLVPLPLSRSALSEGIDLLSLTDGTESTEYVSSSTRIFEAGWTVTILTPTGVGRAGPSVAVHDYCHRHSAPAAASGQSERAAPHPGSAGAARGRAHGGPATRGRGTPRRRNPAAADADGTGAGWQAGGAGPDVGGAEP